MSTDGLPLGALLFLFCILFFQSGRDAAMRCETRPGASDSSGRANAPRNAKHRGARGRQIMLRVFRRVLRLTDCGCLGGSRAVRRRGKDATTRGRQAATQRAWGYPTSTTVGGAGWWWKGEYADLCLASSHDT